MWLKDKLRKFTNFHLKKALDASSEQKQQQQQYDNPVQALPSLG